LGIGGQDPAAAAAAAAAQALAGGGAVGAGAGPPAPPSSSGSDPPSGVARAYLQGHMGHGPHWHEGPTCWGRDGQLSSVDCWYHAQPQGCDSINCHSFLLAYVFPHGQ
jgi:hypothetical protein